METLYLINLDKPFKGYCDATVTKETGHVHYTGKTLPEYLKEESIKNYHLLEWDDFYELYYKKHLNSLQGDFREISAEQYDDWLNCLPPMRWGNIARGVNMFFIMEAYTADLHECVLKIGNKHYSALRSKFIKGEEIINQLKKQGII